MREWKFFYKFESKDQIFAFTKSNQIPYQYLDKNLHNVNSAKSSKVKLTFKWADVVWVSTYGTYGGIKIEICT